MRLYVSFSWIVVVKTLGPVVVVMIIVVVVALWKTKKKHAHQKQRNYLKIDHIKQLLLLFLGLLLLFEWLFYEVWHECTSSQSLRSMYSE